MQHHQIEPSNAALNTARAPPADRIALHRLRSTAEQIGPVDRHRSAAGRRRLLMIMIAVAIVVAIVVLPALVAGTLLPKRRDAVAPS